MMSVPDLTLNNGVTIPQLGFGVFQIPPDATRKATLAALEVGYRHVDTAQMYGNEAGVGQAVRDSGLDRGDVFVTSKLDNSSHAYDDALAAFDRSLAELEFDYLDLFLVHWPMPAVGDFVETWRAMEEIYRSGRSKAVGVSNFQPNHLNRLRAETDVLPAVNQVEVHPYFGNEAVRDANRRHGVITEAWSPLAQGAIGDDAALGEIATVTGKTVSQVVLRWHLQRGDIVFPKTSKVERMRENFDVFDVELTDDQMATVGGLDRGEDGRRGPNPDTFDYIPD